VDGAFYPPFGMPISLFDVCRISAPGGFSIFKNTRHQHGLWQLLSVGILLKYNPK
jgi:hypothetical protein